MLFSSKDLPALLNANGLPAVYPKPGRE